MDDFNSVCSDLVQHLKLSGEIDGKIYWYNGTPELLLKMLGFLLPESERYSTEIEDMEG